MPNFPKNTGFKLSDKKRFDPKNSKVRFNAEEACPGTPLYRKTLDGGIKAEANDDGTIFIDKSVEPGSPEEREILAHEMRHLTEMKIGKLKYDDDSITYNGQKYQRDKGKILYEGEWIPEGGKQFPWEKH